MSKIDNLVFIDRLPCIDLHGFESEVARVAIIDFINDNLKLKNDLIVIIHGIGNGILRKTTSEVLKKNSNVLDYRTYYYNNGCTIVELNVEKCNKK